MVALSILAARVDYCNSLLYGTSSDNLRKLQVTQNALARVVCQATRTRSEFHRTAPVSSETTHRLQARSFVLQGEAGLKFISH